jgi:fatty-acyl-CoA synthase
MTEAVQHETIADLLLARVGDQHPGLRTRERTWTWDEVVRESAARAELLAEKLDRTRPPHIGILLDNVPDFVFWAGAAALAGVAIVGINPTRRGADLEQEVRHVDCQLIITDSAGRQLLDGLDVGVPADRFVLVDDPTYPEAVGKHAAAVPAKAHGVEAGTLMLLLFTSGTTGMSKAARCSQGRLARLAYANCAKYDVDRDDVCYCCMPLFHGNALMGLWAPALSQGATIALVPKFSASGFLPDVRFYGATYFTYVGKAIAYVLALPEGPHDRDNDLDHGFGTEASPDDQAEFARRFGCRLVEAYGSSEGTGHVTKVPDAPPGALGRPSSEDVAILDPETARPCPPARLDEHGRLLNPDEAIGEIADRGAAARFEGYYNNEEANRERVRDGWYWSGDLGYLDEAGFIYFAGRKGDWVRVDGENSSTLAVERILRRHPDVLAAAAFGIADPRSGDQLMVALEVRDIVGFDVAAFAAFLAQQPDLGTKATPRFVRVAAALPTTGSNKLMKKQMQAEAWRSSDAVYAWRGRGEPDYRRMSEEDKASLEAEFFASGRQRLLPTGPARV